MSQFMLVSACVFAFGVLVGVAELSSRHSDHRFLAIVSPPSLGYLLLNGILSLAALAAIEFARPEWLGFAPDNEGNPFLIILAAGFGAATFFRSSIFKIKTADGDLSVGPALIIDIFLQIIDEAVDRSIGEIRQTEIAQIMAGVDFDKAVENLPIYCFAALKRLSKDNQIAFGQQMTSLLTQKTLLPEVRTMSLGLAIMSLTGKKFLAQGVKQLGSHIQR